MGKSLPKSPTDSAEARLDDLLEEITRKLQAGEKIDLEQVVRQSPQWEDRLRKMWPGLLALAAIGDSNAPNDLSIGTVTRSSEFSLNGTLGDFRLIREIGRGGMGVVYEAQQVSLKRRVALKVLPMAGMLDPRQLQRFQNEAQAAASLHHPNIVPVHSVGSDRGVYYYAMQYIDGRSLAEVIAELRKASQPNSPGGNDPPSVFASQLTSAWLEPSQDNSPAFQPTALYQSGLHPPTGHNGSFVKEPSKEINPPNQAALSTNFPAGLTQHPAGGREYIRNIAQLGVQIAEALDYAHGLGITHRDIKPSNLLLDYRGTVWVADFGLAQIGTEGSLTFTGEMLGTLRYMSPEQSAGQRGVLDQRTDIYSLGITLYELLTLQPAFLSTDRKELLRQVLTEEPRRPRQLNPTMPRDLETIVLKAIAKEPQSRYGSAQALADDLRRLLENRPILARRPTFIERGVRFTKRNKTAVISTAVGLLVPMILLCAVAISSAKERASRQRQLISNVNQALEEAALLRGKAEEARDDVGKWYAALSAAQRGLSFLDSGEVDDALEQRVSTVVEELHREWNLAKLREDQRILDRWMVNEMEQIQIEQSNVKDGNFDRHSALPKYITAFQKYGIDLESLEPEEAAQRIRSQAIRDELVVALDDCGMLWPTNDPEMGEKFLTIAQLADTENRFRQELRSLLLDKESRVMELIDPKIVVSQAPHTILMAAHLLNGVGRGEQALELLRETQLHYPNDFWINNKLGEVAEMHSMANDQLRFITVSVALRPQSPGAWVNLGLALLNAGQPQEALIAYRKAILLKPDYAEAHGNLASTLHQLDRLEEAIQAYREAIRLKPDYTKARLVLGNALVDHGQFEEAIAAYQEIIRLEPDHAEAHFNLGYALVKHGQSEKAIAAYQEAIRLKTDYAEAHFNLGISFGKLGRLEEAIQAYREAIRLKPDLDGTHIHLGRSLLDLGREEEAVEAYREAIRLKPDFAEAHADLGHSLSILGRVKEAVKAYREAIRLKPDFAEAHFNLGNSLGNVGQLEDAIAAYQEALRLKPDFAEAHVNLGNHLTTLLRVEEAVKAFQEAIRLKPDNAAAHYNLANCLSDLGRLDEAIQAHREAIRLKPDYAEAYCNLGLILARQGEWYEALALLQRGHELGTQDEGWRYPSDQWIKQTEQVIALDQRLAEVLKGRGEPVQPTEWIQLAMFCQMMKMQHYSAAVRFYEEAFRQQPDLQRSVSSHRYNAACAAIFAVSARPDSEEKIDEAQRSEIRKKAHTWLRQECQDLKAFRQDPRARKVVVAILNKWQQDPNFTAVRDSESIIRLPQNEQKAWRTLWMDVDKTLKEFEAEDRPINDPQLPTAVIVKQFSPAVAEKIK